MANKTVIVKNRKTGIEYRLTPESWVKISASKAKDAYQVIQQPEQPKELKAVRQAKVITKAESDNTHGTTDTIDQLPDGNVGDVE